jgi:hypothetical protein
MRLSYKKLNNLLSERKIASDISCPLRETMTIGCEINSSIFLAHKDVFISILGD